MHGNSNARRFLFHRTALRIEWTRVTLRVIGPDISTISEVGTGVTTAIVQSSYKAAEPYLGGQTSFISGAIAHLPHPKHDMRPLDFFAAFALFSILSNAQYLPGLASQIPELSIFFTLLNSTSELYSQIERGGVTILSPTNEALNSAGLTSPNATTATQLDALLRYHILEGVHPAASLAGSPIFLPSMLQNRTYTSVSGGQVVETFGVDGAPSLVSALWSKSQIVTSDIFYLNGLVHSIDKVLGIPEQIVPTITAANLTDFAALSEALLLARPEYAHDLAGAAAWPEFTFFAPNSPQYSSNYTGWDNLTAEQEYAIYHYHFVNGSVLYSSNLTNGSTFTTSAGLKITTWTVNGSTYVNDAKVIQKDLLTANGVMQVLDKPLDPNNTDAHPIFDSEIDTHASSGAHRKGGLSTAAQAGLGVGIAVACLAVLLVGAYLIRSKRKSRKAALKTDTAGHVHNIAHEADHTEVAEASEDAGLSKGEMSTASNTWELAAKSRVQELQADRRYELGS